MITVRKISRLYRFHIQEALNPHILGALMEFLSLMCIEMAASAGQNGALTGGVAGPALIPQGTPRAIKGNALCYSHILYVTI